MICTVPTKSDVRKDTVTGEHMTRSGALGVEMLTKQSKVTGAH